ncbi:MAG: ABC transporter substrate-binding protein [Paracoccaceae bacterium]
MLTRREVLHGTGATLALGAAFSAMPALAQTRPLRIGVLIAEADHDGQEQMVEPYVSQMRLGLELAASEINAAGGILGRPIELVYANDGGSPAPGAAAAHDMVIEGGCEVLISGFITAIRSFLARQFADHDGPAVPVFHAFGTEGNFCNANITHTGPTSAQSLRPMTEWLGDRTSARPFTISDWSPSQRAVSAYLYGNTGILTGAALVTTPVQGNYPGQFRGVMQWADEMESETIYVSVPRPYAVNVANHAIDAGVAEGKTFAFLDFSEWHAAQLQPGADVVTCLPFVASDPAPAVQDFVGRANAMPMAGGLVTHVAFTHYNSLMALKAAMERSGEATGPAAIAGLRGLSLETATGMLAFDESGYATMTMHVARATPGALDIVHTAEAVPAAATCRV